MIPAIKDIRVFIDGDIKRVMSLLEATNRGPGARELALVKTKLEEAKMWAGKALGVLEEKLPKEY